MENKIYLEFDHIKDKINQINIEDIDVILCITRGGLVPAGLLSYQLNVKDIINIKVESYQQQEQHELFLKPLNLNELNLLKRAKKILIVDDIYDTGNTIHAVKGYLTNANHIDPNKLETFCCVEKVSGAVNYSLYTITNNSWIMFPWDFE